MRSFWARGALLIGLLSLGGYGYLTGKGLVLGAPKGRLVPADVRSAPDGYRSFHFWHGGSGGYRGGK